MTSKRVITSAVVLALVVAGALWFYRRAQAAGVPAYRFATVQRGEIRSTVSATGSLEAVTTVQIGTQVSGKLSAIYVDFNDRVKKGQLLARIEPTLQQQAVRDAQAGLDAAQSQLELARRENDRNEQLIKERVITAPEYEQTASAYRVAQANLRSAQIALERARENLSYTAIRSPIDGVVVERNVDVGQTVAASLSAPQLFLIAQDLREMRILAAVDESDIGRIATGQPVSFTVSSYPNDTFQGAVRQVRLQSAVTDNVVSYTTVVGVRNPDGKLLPGMTATVRFITDSAVGALLVPNAALRFQPTPEMLAVSAPKGSDAPAEGSPDAAPAGTDGRARRAAVGRTDSTATLWHLDAGGRLTATAVRTGLADGQRTQVEGRGVEAGMQVIIGTISPGEVAASPSTNPLQPQAQQRGPRRPVTAF